MSLSTKTESVFEDAEFGSIPYKRIASSHHVRIRLSTNGKLRATLPLFASTRSIGQLIDNSRDELRALLSHQAGPRYSDGQTIGHSHRLQLIPNRSGVLKMTITGQTIAVSHPADLHVDASKLQDGIREQVAKALRKESKAYLPRRLAHLASMGGFSYDRVRFAHQSGRWGSCSSTGTISLNIALMTLPLDIIDYVLVHELAHTKQMNHSNKFWDMVGQYYPNYKAARKVLKSHNPYL